MKMCEPNSNTTEDSSYARTPKTSSPSSPSSSSTSSTTNVNNNSNRCLSFNLQATSSMTTNKNAEGPSPHCQRNYSLKCILYPSFFFGTKTSSDSCCTSSNNNNNNNIEDDSNSTMTAPTTTTIATTIMKCFLAFVFGLAMVGMTFMSNGKTLASYGNFIRSSTSTRSYTHQFKNLFPKFIKRQDVDYDYDTNKDPDNAEETSRENTVYQDEYDQTKIITKTIFPLHFSNNDSSACIHNADGSYTFSTNDDDYDDNNNNDCKHYYHLPQQAYEYTTDENSLYLNETDYNLLLNVTTQIGSFDPLPSTFVPTTKPVAVLDGGSGGGGVKAFNYKFGGHHNHNTSTMRKMTKPKRFIPVLEARGTPDRDIDKNEHGHRRDTIPIASAIDAHPEKKVHSAVFQFLEEDNGRDHYAVKSNLVLKEYLRSVAHGIVVRINPGTLSPLSQKKCDDMLRELSKDGLVILSHPDVSSTLGAKDSLVKIRDLKCGMEDTEVYYTPESFHEGFRRRISYEPRVIKQNRGCQGEGVWIVKLKDENAYCNRDDEECIVSLDAELELMEAFDNHVEYHTVQEFLNFCSFGRMEDSPLWTTKSNGNYFDGGLEANAMVVDQRFLPRIVEGEVRCLMVGSELVEIVHKKPKEGGLSATLESGAIYTRYPPDDPKFAKLVKNFKEDVPHIMDSFGMSDQPLPLLWTVDYIYGETDEDLFAGEINCSCPGITKQLHIAPTIAKVAFNNVFAHER